MRLKFKIVFAAAVLLNVAYSQLQDLTRTPDATGPEVVEAVTDILGKSCVFPDELLYLRRVAYVESHDGADNNKTNFNGGIWRVDEATFNQTKSSPALATLRAKIQQTLFIDWGDALYSDLRRPLFSAIASEFAAILKTGSGGIPNTVETQATLWGGAARANIFVKMVDELSKHRTYINDADIVFLLDSSASLSPGDFEKAKEFTEKVLQGFEVDSGKIRVGVVAYSTIVYPQLSLNNGLSRANLLRAVANVSYTPGGTATHAALQYVLDKVFTAQNGARDNSVKIVILVTDGRSDDRVATAENAEKLKQAGVNIFTVGVGDSVDRNELTRVASSPQCVHVKMVSNYTSLPAVNHEIQQQSLKSAVILKPGKYNFSCDSQIKTLILPTSSQTTVEITTDDGKLAVFGAASNAFTPSSVLYSFMETVEPGIPAQIYIRDGSQIGLAFMNMTSGGCKTTFEVLVSVGDRIATGTRVTCVGGGITSTCSSTDYNKSPFIITGIIDPSIPNICGSGKDLFQAPYPGKPDRYLYCSSGTMMVIFCPTGEIFDLASSACKTGTIAPPTHAPTSPKATAAPNTAKTPPTTAAPIVTNAVTTATTNQPIITPTHSSASFVNPCTAQALASENFVFPYPPDNKQYIKCGAFVNTANLLHCPSHRFFDAAAKTCIFYEVIVNGSVNGSAIGVSTTLPTFVDIKNPCDPNHPNDVEYHTHPTDPHKFIQCDAFGEAFVKTCRPNTVWREDILACVVTGPHIVGK